MNQPIEDILDIAIKQLRQGRSPDAILAMYPEQSDELNELLSIATVGLSIPQATVPTPLRQHRYAEQAKLSWWTKTIPFLKFGIMPLSLVFALMGGKVLVDKTHESLPADNLYTLKRASEQLRFNLTRDPNKQASLQVEMVQRRLDELKQVSATNNPSKEAAALAELQDQSQKTFATVPQVAAAEAIAKNDSSLLNSLVAINKQQKQVLEAIQPQKETEQITATAKTENEANGQKLASLIATVREQTLVDLDNKVSVTGEGTISNDKTRVTVENNTFAVNGETTITLADGSTAKLSEIGNKIKVTVIGKKTPTGLIAKSIAIIESSPTTTDAKATKTPAVKGVSTKPEQADSTTNTETPREEPVNDPNRVTGGFISEPGLPSQNP